MIRSRFLFFPVLFCCCFLHAQDINGYYQENYSGIVGAAFNPASLSDNNYSLDILLGGIALEAGNNYVGVRRSDIFRADFNNSLLLRRDWQTKKAGVARASVLLPGMMMSNEKMGWGIDMRIRTYLNIDGVEQKLAHTLSYELNDPPYFGQSMHNRHIGVTGLSWFEINGTYAKTIRSGGDSYLSVGIRPKLLWGLGAAYAFVNDANYIFYNDSTLNVDAANARFGHSDNFTFNSALQPSWKLRFNPGLGVDAGIVYEHRPATLQQDAGKFRPWPGFRKRPNYDYRIGVALTDLGAIFFRHGELSDTYEAGANRWDLNNPVFDSTAPPPLYATFKQRVGGSKQGKAFLMRLPLALSINYDRRITKDIYINATAFTALYLRNVNAKRVHELTRLSITPRWERRWFGFWMPLTFTRLGNLTLGSGLRFGPLVIGTNDILMYLLPDKKIYSADFYVLLKVPLFPTGKKGNGWKPKSSHGNVDDCAN